MASGEEEIEQGQRVFEKIVIGGCGDSDLDYENIKKQMLRVFEEKAETELREYPKIRKGNEIETKEKSEINWLSENRKDNGNGTKEKVKCFNCNKIGHISRDCEDNIKCYNCGRFGHASKECKTRDWNIKKCHVCKKMGHLDEECWWKKNTKGKEQEREENYQTITRTDEMEENDFGDHIHKMEQCKENVKKNNKNESFEIELRGLPTFYSLTQLEKLLKVNLQLETSNLKPFEIGRNVAFVKFEDEANRFKAITILNGYKWMGCVLSAKEADDKKKSILMEKPDDLKVQNKDSEDVPLKNSIDIDYENLSLQDRIQKAVTPYHDMPYEAQIKEKEKIVKSFLRKFANEFAHHSPELKKFVQLQKGKHKGQICEVDSFIESPARYGYCNKCDFYIGKNKESDKPVVGFRLANYKEGSIEVGPVDHLTHINDKMKRVVKCMEAFLETSSHPLFDPFSKTGFWHQLIVRTSRSNDTMIIIRINSQNLSSVDLSVVKRDVKKFFTEGDGKSAGVTSIFFHTIGKRKPGEEAEYEHVHGKMFIEETILGKRFSVAPDAYLKVNTEACELLYKKVADIANIDSTSIVFDICCGVGTIGLSIAENSYKTMGVECVQSAVEYARKNAESNGIFNVTFYHKKAEDYIDTMLERAHGSNVIAIIDPPRVGLGVHLINSLRKYEYLKKIVYISCDPHASLPNLQALTDINSKVYKEFSYVPTRAIPVDMFPDTPHFELILVFRRYGSGKSKSQLHGKPGGKENTSRSSRSSSISSTHKVELDEKRKEDIRDDSKPFKRKGDRVEENPYQEKTREKSGDQRNWDSYDNNKFDDWDGYDRSKRDCKSGDDGGRWNSNRGGRGWSSRGDRGGWRSDSGRRGWNSRGGGRGWNTNDGNEGWNSGSGRGGGWNNNDDDRKWKFGGGGEWNSNKSDGDWNSGGGGGGWNRNDDGGRWKSGDGGGRWNTNDDGEWNSGDGGGRWNKNDGGGGCNSGDGAGWNSGGGDGAEGWNSGGGDGAGGWNSGGGDGVGAPDDPHSDKGNKRLNAGLRELRKNLSSRLGPSSSNRGSGDDTYGEGFQEGLKALLMTVFGCQLSDLATATQNLNPKDVVPDPQKFKPQNNMQVVNDFSNMNIKENQSSSNLAFNVNNPGGNTSGPGIGTNVDYQSSSGSYPAHLINQPVTYPTCVTNPKQGDQEFGGMNENSGNRGNNYGWSQDGGKNDFQNEPASKRWRHN